jgi:hypothetical protein
MTAELQYRLTLRSPSFSQDSLLIMNTSIELKPTTPLLLLLPFLLACFAFSQRAQAAEVDILPGGNTAYGSGVLVDLTSGVWNSGFGFEALNHDTGGGNNAATGVRALFSNTSGSNNNAIGVYALYGNTTGWYNNAVGAYALASNISGSYNTANGYGALYRNTANNNTANGYAALYFNTAGDRNTANGVQALNRNTTGFINTATGYQALYSNTTGVGNTAHGAGALFSNNGDQNTATGYSTLTGNTTGFGNTANGFFALANNTAGHDNTALGIHALYTNTTGDNNTAVGADAGTGVTTADNVICIGAQGTNVSNSCFIGNVYGVNEGGTISAVYINSNGQLGTQPPASSRRFKKEIKPMDQTSEAILALKPVTFRYKSDKTGTPPQFGLIAEEVAEVNPDLVVRDENGEIYTVRYEAVNAMLLNEFLKEHRKVEELKYNFQSAIAQQQKEIQALTAQLKEQAVQIQKVSAQLATASPSGGGFEMSGPAARTVLNNR